MGFPRITPKPTDSDRPFWDAARKGEMRMQRCRACMQWRFPPAPVCANCGSKEAGWEALSGLGTITSFVVFHKPYFEQVRSAVPYAVVLVRFDEGPRYYGNLLDVPCEQIRIGMRVRTEFVDIGDGFMVPQFVSTNSAERSDGAD